MFEDRTFDNILKTMLDSVDPGFDKREGSIIYDALAPAALELAKLYRDLDDMLNQTFADTADREFLIRRAAERRLVPYGATHAVVRGVFNIDVGRGARFSLDKVNFRTIGLEGRQDNTDFYIYTLECEEAGPDGNITGSLIPIDNISDLTYAKVTEIISYGEAEEDTEKFRKRYFDSINNISFGGNIAEYREWVSAMEGVGGVKVYRADEWQGPGTVKIVITTPENTPPSEELLKRIKEELDPSDLEGEGLGLAPIGHIVTVQGAKSTEINISLVIKTDKTNESLSEDLRRAFCEYIDRLNIRWELEETITLYISHIIATAISVKGVEDVSEVSINGSPENLELDRESIAVLGEISFEEV